MPILATIWVLLILAVWALQSPDLFSGNFQTLLLFCFTTYRRDYEPSVSQALLQPLISVASQRPRELWPGCCPRAPDKQTDMPLDSGTPQNVSFPGALPEERWARTSPLPSRSLVFSASLGVGDGDKNSVPDHVLFSDITVTQLEYAFEVKNLRILCPVCGLILLSLG